MVGIALALSMGSIAACGAGAPSDDASQAESDLAATHFTNPVIPMFERPPGVPSSEPAGSPGHPTEGCPDPSALKTRSGDVYIYCTSYTFRFGRHDGFPIFKARSLGGPYKRVGALIPDGGASRSTWPQWVRDANGRRDGDFWGPDVHELPNGKFVAGYSAPCGATRCVGIAFADHPEGPWKHPHAPFITPSNNGVGSEASYDPSLLITKSGELYLYWVVVNHGVFGARVQATRTGELEHVRGSDVHVIADRARGQRGEGPSVIEHAGGFYELYSTGSLEYGYHVGVRRGVSPLARFDEEGPEVIKLNHHFVATGGNSVVHNAVSGTDFLVYHAIVVPPHGGCPRLDPEYARPVKMVPIDGPAPNPYCRVQGERQAMIDPLAWARGADGVEWPLLKNGTGTPSVGRTPMP